MPVPSPLKPVGVAAGGVFEALSRLRGTKSLHPRGVVHAATLTITGAPAAAGVPLFERRAEHPALVRFSRGAGLPRPLPDVLGMAIRLPDVHGRGRHQDFLLVTSGDGAVVHHLLLPAFSFRRLPYSSVLPYGTTGGDLIVIGARPRGRAGPRSSLEGAAFEVGMAPLGGRLAGVGTLTIGPQRPPGDNAIRFNPWNTGGGLQPATFLNRLRDWAYPGSQAGWQGAEPQDMTDDAEAAVSARRTAAPPAARTR